MPSPLATARPPSSLTWTQAVASLGLTGFPSPHSPLPTCTLLCSQWGLSESSVSTSIVTGVKATPYGTDLSPSPHPLPSPVCPLSSRLTGLLTLPSLCQAHFTFASAVPSSWNVAPLLSNRPIPSHHSGQMQSAPWGWSLSSACTYVWV